MNANLTHAATSGFPLLIGISVLWLLAQQVNLSAPITAGKIVSTPLFVLVMAWFLVSVVGLMR